MEVLRTISLYTESKDMGFMIIGGHAINYYGFSRQTGDIDLVVKKSQKQLWHDLLTRLHYQAGQNDDRFARFRPAELGSWPIDLMFVDDTTFQKLESQSVDAQIGVAEVKVISARHLATMKIHALKYFQEHRFAKDYQDLLNLLRSQKTGIAKTELKELCEKYASLELFNKITNDIKIR